VRWTPIGLSPSSVEDFMAFTPARTMPGVLELLPLDQIAFQRMLDVIRRNYERFGFLPIETPVIEYSDVLLTKTGGETERQVYFVQSTGALNAVEKMNALATNTIVPELALRFDLTVPLARYVAEHERDLSFPFAATRCSACIAASAPSAAASASSISATST
jgi:Histidyl-tRNA synthetase